VESFVYEIRRWVFRRLRRLRRRRLRTVQFMERSQITFRHKFLSV